MTLNISFPNYQSSNRVPGTYIDFDSSNANTSAFNQRTLLIGQITASGTATANVPTIISSLTDARTKCGANSMLYDMIVNYRIADSFGELWILPLADNAAGTTGTGTVTFTGTATAAGTFVLYVTDTAVQVAIAVGDTAANCAGKLVTAMANYPNLPVTVGAVAAVVTFTSVHKGVAASDIPLNINYLGSANNEFLPAGITAVASAFTPGTTDPVLDTALANMSNLTFDFIASPYTATTPMAAIKTLLSVQTGRWSWTNMLYGIAFNAFRGTFGATTTFGLTQNDPHITTLPALNSPTPVGSIAAIYAGTCAASLRSDPAMPLTQLTLTGMMAPTVDQQLTLSELNTFYYSGISGYVTQPDGTSLLQRAVTNYQKNTAGLADNSYLDVETDAQLTYVARKFESQMSSKFARKKLVNDGVAAAASSNTVTPSICLAYMVGIYAALCDEGVVQGLSTFSKTARAQNAGNGQVSIYAPVILANQLREIATVIAFSKP